MVSEENVMVWGSAIGAAGSLIGGFLGRKSAKKAEARAYERFKRRIQDTAVDAKQAGIHPLAALGSAVNYVPAQGSSALGDSIATSAEMIGRGVDQAAEPKPKERKEDPLQRQLLEARIDRERAEIEALKAATSRTRASALREATRGVGPGIQAKLNGEEKVQPLTTRFGSHGESTPAYTPGTDLGEQVVGLALDTSNWFKSIQPDKGSKRPNPRKDRKRNTQPTAGFRPKGNRRKGRKE
jgi:hypothetical protein